METEFQIVESGPKRIFVIHSRTRCNAVPGGLHFTSKRRAKGYIREAAPFLIQGNLLRVNPSTSGQCVALARKYCAR